MRFIRDFFEFRRLELSDFEPDHALVRDRDVTGVARAPKLMRRGHEEFLIYHPNAAADGREAQVDTARTPILSVDLNAAGGRFAIEWYRTEDGQSQLGNDVIGGDWRELAAPWTGADVVVRLWQK